MVSKIVPLGQTFHLFVRFDGDIERLLGNHVG